MQVHVAVPAWPRLVLANSMERMCLNRRGARLMGMVLQMGKSAAGSRVNRSKGYWPTLGEVQDNDGKVIKCQALGVLTHSYLTTSLYRNS